MPIVSSVLTQEGAQSDGRKWMHELHTDHLSRQYVYQWLADAGIDANAVMAARVPSILDGLARQEIQRNVQGITIDGSLTVTTTDYSTVSDNFAVLREFYRTATETQAIMAGDFLSSQTDALLRNVFGYTQAQVDTLRANKLTPSANAAAGIRAATGVAEVASYYVRSGAAGAGTGADWTNAYTTLTAAFSGHAAGDVYYVSEDHAESTASAISLNSAGSQASSTLVYCVNHSGSVPPVSADLRTTATITTTGNSGLNFINPTYYYGIQFNCGSGAVAALITIMSAGAGCIRFDSCALKKNGTTASGQAILIGGNNVAYVVLNNTTLQFGNTADGMRCISTGIWMGASSSITGATVPTSLFPSSPGSLGVFGIVGVDLSAIATGPIFKNQSTTSLGLFRVIDCKLASSVAVAETPLGRGWIFDAIRCDSAATNYRDERYTYEGTQTVETSIVRTGGATDGTTPQSWKIVTTANSKWVTPFESQPISIWNSSTSAITTLTIYGTTTGGGVPNNDDIWVEVEYLGSGSTPQGSFIATTKADGLAASAATNNSSDASTWGGGGAGNGFKIVVPSFTPGMAGPINVTIKVAKLSSTYYIDPKLSV